MTQYVTDERGQQHEFPDEASPQMILQALGRAPRVAETTAPASVESPANEILRQGARTRDIVQDYPAQILHGLGRGVAALPGLGGDISNFLGAGVDWLGNKLAPETNAGLKGLIAPIPNLPTSAQTIGAAERNVIGERPTPVTPGSRVAGNIAQYIPGSLIPMGGQGATVANLAKQGLLGTVSGASAEGAREAGLPPAIQAAAGLFPGLALSSINALSGRTGAAGQIRQALKDTPESTWEAGAARQAAGREIGVPLMGQEALAPEVGGGPLGQLASAVAATPAGAPIISKVFEARPAQIKTAAKTAIEKLGPTATADKIVENLKTTAQNTIDAFDRNRISRTSKLYRAGDPVRIPESAIQPIVAEVDKALAAAPAKGPLTTELKYVRDNLLTNGKPQTLSSALNTTKKDLVDKIRPAYGLDAGGELRSHAGVIGPIIQSIRDTLHQHNSYYAKADNLFANLTDEMNSVIGTADNPSWIRRLADAKNNAQARSLLLDPENISPDTIRNVADMFRGQNRLENLGAFMRHAMENEFNSAARQLQSGANPAMGVKFGNAVYGTEKQRVLMQNYWDQLDQTGGAGRGMETFFKVVDRTGRTPGMGSPTATRLQMGEALAGSPASTAAQLGTGAIMAATGIPAGQLAGGYLVSSGIAGSINRQFAKLGAARIAKILTDPDSVGKLRALAKKDPASPAAATSVLAILGGRASANKEPSK